MVGVTGNFLSKPLRRGLGGYGAGATDNEGRVNLLTLGKSLGKFGAVEIELTVVNWEGECQQLKPTADMVEVGESQEVVRNYRN